MSTAHDDSGAGAFTPAWTGERRVPARPGKLSVIVPTRNEEQNLRECLESAAWADELIVCDSFSTDGTVALAREFTPNVVQHEYVHSAAQKNWIIPQASCEWVLILDADERVSPELRAAVESIVRENGPCNGYRIRRRTYFLGKLIKHCGWSRDYVHRLFRRDQGRYEDRAVHAEVEVEGPVGTLREPLVHYTDRDLGNYFEKFDRYSALAAADLFGRGVQARWWHLLLKPPAKFLKMYVLNLGFLDGFHGFLVCRLAAMSTFARYARLWDMNRRGSTGPLPRGRR